MGAVDTSLSIDQQKLNLEKEKAEFEREKFGFEQKRKYISTALTVVGGLSGFILANFHPFSSAESNHTATGEIGLKTFFKLSNDFLGTSSKINFSTLITSSQREIWFYGSTFYISVDQYKDQLLKKAEDGVNLNFVILDPEARDFKSIAQMHNTTPDELRQSCILGLQTLVWLRAQLQLRGKSQKLRILISQNPFSGRAYFFDPTADEGFTYLVPHVSNASTQVLPGLLFSNRKAAFHRSYFEAVVRLTESESVVPLDTWLQLHPNVLQRG
jgi:hypothetical protein